jgi:hypothetical protein
MNETHPVVGAWRVVVEVPGAPAGTNLANFAADGTVVVTFPTPNPAPPGSARKLEFWSAALGSWRPSGARNVAMRFVSLGADEVGTPIGSHTITATAEVANDGASWRGPFTIVIASLEGETLASVSGTVRASRIAAQ